MRVLRAFDRLILALGDAVWNWGSALARLIRRR